MTTDLRRRSTPHHASAAHHSLVSRLGLALLAACAISLLLAVGTASALVVTVGGQKYGVQPHATSVEDFHALPESPLHYGGGPVVHANSIYAIYWDPSVTESGRIAKYHGEWIELIDQFFEGVAAESGTLGNIFALTGQYTESNGLAADYSTTFRGSATDTDSYPTSACTDPDPTLNQDFECLTDAQLRTELRSYISSHKLTAGPGAIFYLLTPPDVTVCTDAGTTNGHCSDSSRTNPWTAFANSPSPQEETEKGSYERSFCSYHAVTSTSSGETLLYAAIPWVAGSFGSGAGTENKPLHKNGSDCQNGTGTMQEPNQLLSLSVDGYYDRGLPDVLVDQIAEQQVATITDPDFNGWFEPISGNEAPDQCRNWFEESPVVGGSGTPGEKTEAGTLNNQVIAGRTYYVNTIYNQAAAFNGYPGLRCELHNNLVPKFSAPVHASAGETVGFNGTESDVTLGQSAAANSSSGPLHRATFTWSFGDGTSVSGPAYTEENPIAPLFASVFHNYQYGGTYEVKLTIQDAAGNVASTAEDVVIAGPERPTEGGGSGGSGSGGSGSGSSTSSTSSPSAATGTGTSTSAPAAPVPAKAIAATQTVSSRSLSAALKEGVVVHYSVSAPVAGRFEVLLASATARRIALRGDAATGLAKGTPAQTVIAKAIVVTTKGGQSTYKIKFSKATAAKLRKLGKVTLMIRLVVHNASSPTATTVLDTVNLR